MRNPLQAHPHPPLQSAALLLLRLVTGVAFMLHGWPKIQQPFSWMGEDAFAPGFFQALAALSEFGGGAAWVLGFLTPLAALGIGATMVVAAWFHAVMQGDPFVPSTLEPSWELPAVFICVAVILLAFGPGRYSADWLLFGPDEKEQGEVDAPPADAT